ncbi:MAG: lipoyl synthase [Candidatus Thalassarchaeaceae archaeon]|nr:lipoyl synthase [Candidatus Thalassarchaeaceae archaeon]MDP6702950.1 lipoyl synthase [Candidatus Thalassarchaeaceae archaeon]MDP7004273.1 lipoyl synthase [Candidatus Thalassarchaeaceae archaeon]
MDRRLPTIDFGDALPGGCGGVSRGSSRERRMGARKKLPDWFRTSLPTGVAQIRYKETKANVREHGLFTVCEEAMCPNIHDCWGRGTATFMIAGEVCTRGCRFCAVGTVRNPPLLDDNEPVELAGAIARMGLSYAVITVVNRDDLSDGGASHYRDCIKAVNENSPDVGLELLCSDLDGNIGALAALLEGLPLRVFAHNVECVPRLDDVVRDPRASFDQSLEVLCEAKRLRPDLLTKTSIMVGLGESDEEIVEAMGEIRGAGVDMITLGQYLQPSYKHLAVDRFPKPIQFADWDCVARELGFKAVASGPLVRSSYRAGLLWEEATGMEPVVTRESTGSAVSHLISKEVQVKTQIQMS